MSSQIVQSVLDRYSELTLVSDAELEHRRRQFLPYILRALNNPDYGFLIKTGEKIQDDIICMRNRQHLDCMTAVQESGKWRIRAAWKNQGLIQDRWKFGELSQYESKIQPPLPINQEPEPVPVPTPGDLEEKVNLCLTKLDQILDVLNTHFR